MSFLTRSGGYWLGAVPAGVLFISSGLIGGPWAWTEVS